uniref:Sex combs reduced n=1 Tax=Timema shepardi TaxID=629360 RepID=A0A7R9AKM6_TIMSH|nr:unnamed protein product [Timema shepardi]
MSSYQFVNSLASCYANQAPGQRSGASPVNGGHPQQHPSAAGADYYNPNAASVQGSYPPTCYSPQQQVHPQHYAQHPYASAGNVGQSQHLQNGSQGMMDYTQLHPSHQRLGGAATHLQHPSPGTVSPPLGVVSTPVGSLLNNNSVSASSCKYAAETASTTGVSSPQDLSTTGGPPRGSPPLQGPSQSVGGSSSKPPIGSAPSTTASTTTSRGASSATSPAGASGAGPTQAAATASSAVSQSSSSPASSTSSASSTTGSNNNNGGNNNSSGKQGGGTTPAGNPPQIYPWMKRVHLGQRLVQKTRGFDPLAVINNTPVATGRLATNNGGPDKLACYSYFQLLS